MFKESINVEGMLKNDLVVADIVVDNRPGLG